MNDKRIAVALALLILAALACNPPGAQPSGAPPPTVTPFIPPQEATSEPPTQQPEPPTPEPATTAPEASPTATTSPTTTIAPPPTSPPTSSGLLDFPVPTGMDGWQALPNGNYEVTIVLHIAGGAPPFTVQHDVDTFESSQRDYPLVFEHGGCSAIVHTIIVQSADGQSVSHDYWIQVPWCD